MIQKCFLFLHAQVLRFFAKPGGLFLYQLVSRCVSSLLPVRPVVLTVSVFCLQKTDTQIGNAGALVLPAIMAGMLLCLQERQREFLPRGLFGFHAFIMGNPWYER